MAQDWNFASRAKGSSPLGTSMFIGLRSLDVLLQYALLTAGYGPYFIKLLGGRVISPFATFNSSSILGLGLSPYSATILAMAFGSALKQNLWITFVSEQRFPPPFALMISAFNSFFNTANTLVSLWSLTSNAPTANASASFPLSFYLGCALYGIGMFVEFWSEVQRAQFKAKPENKGKPYGGGFFGLATNVNYGGYTLWRTGYAMVAGGWAWGLFIGAMQGYDFISRAIPSMDQYTTEKVSAALPMDSRRMC